MIKFIKLISAIIMILFYYQISLCATYISASFSSALSHMGYENYYLTNIKGSISIDIGYNLRLSYSRKYEITEEKGYKNFGTSDTPNYIYYVAKNEITTDTIDVIIVLFSNNYLTPFIFGGIAFKYYILQMSTDNDINYKYKDPYGPLANFGAGLAIKLNENFALRLTNTWSPGFIRKIDEPTDKIHVVWDSQLDIGLEYKI